MSTLLLAHGGTVGLIFEVGFLAVPILVFTVMATISAKRREHEESEAGEEGEQ